MWSLGSEAEEAKTDGRFRIYGWDGEGERQQRIPRDGDCGETVTGAVSSPPP